MLDGTSGVDELIYSSKRDDPKWDRCVFEFADGGRMRMQDPRRLGGVTLDPDEARLGADARQISLDDLRQALGTSKSPLKARLMSQDRVAGAGNLIVDETLWRAGLDPTREAASLSTVEVKRLHRHLVKAVEDLIARGGSHTGDFLPHRVRGGSCPKDGAPLQRATVGGRTTYWCPRHQV